MQALNKALMKEAKKLKQEKELERGWMKRISSGRTKKGVKKLLGYVTLIKHYLIRLRYWKNKISIVKIKGKIRL